MNTGTFRRRSFVINIGMNIVLDPYIVRSAASFRFLYHFYICDISFFKIAYILYEEFDQSDSAHCDVTHSVFKSIYCL